MLIALPFRQDKLFTLSSFVINDVIKEKPTKMARITVEDCLEMIDNRFAIIHLAAKRVGQLDKGSKRLVDCKNMHTVAALREISAGKVRIDEKRKKTIK